MDKRKNIAVIAVFLTIIFALSLLHIFMPDSALSKAERRKLAQLPELSAESVFSGKYAKSFESYMLDQFPLREQFRTAKSVLKFYVFRQSDNNGVYLSGDSAFKMEYPLNEKQLLYGANKINSVIAVLPEDCRVYYSVIPDKNYFAAETTGHPHIDYDELITLLRDKVSGAEYIDIFPCLSLDDYYRTDAHWKQESIYSVAETLSGAMGSAGELTALSEYTVSTLSPFYGVYCGQSALPLKPDALSYLTSDMTESTTVTGLEFEGERGVYSEELFTGMDGYDLFLSGAQAIVTISCPQAQSDRELIIFRDSFSSSLAPYFIGAYSKITLIDLRYIPSALLSDYVAFGGQDVLFLYSTSLLNSAMLLK